MREIPVGRWSSTRCGPRIEGIDDAKPAGYGSIEKDPDVDDKLVLLVESELRSALRYLPREGFGPHPVSQGDSTGLSKTSQKCVPLRPERSRKPRLGTRNPTTTVNIRVGARLGKP
jgi:hypothetical protein